MGPGYVGCGISQTGTSGSYSYSVTSNPNFPVNLVSWGDAARFVNWLQNGQPTGNEGPGTTETGVYTLNGEISNLLTETRNPGATYFIPSENEWYKAAYYKGGGTNSGYWLYPTQSNSLPSNVLSATGTNNANYYNGAYTDPTNYLTPVGAFVASPGPYGTYDMGGDVWQWNEAKLPGDISGDWRGMRGGAFFVGNPNVLAASYGSGFYPTYEDTVYGFRVGSLPEPGSIALLFAGAVSLLFYAWRWRMRTA